MKNRLRMLVSLLSVFITLFGASLPVLARPAQQGNCSITGTVYRDFNASGDRDALEPPVEGITVTAYDASGGTIQTVTTDDQGEYTLNQLPGETEVRIEFTGIPSFLRFGPDGAGSYTSVAFVTCGQVVGTVDLAVANPGQHCDDNPDLFVTCYRLGDAISGPNAGDEALISTSYTSGSTDLTSVPAGARFGPNNTVLALTEDIGPTWGVALHRQSETLFAGAFLKRHAGFGPGGPGAIYAVDMAGGVSPFTTLTAAGANEALHTDGTLYADRPMFDPWVIDLEAYNLVGKRALGGMTMSDDDSTLWVVNLFDRELYSIPVDNPGGATSRAIPTNLPGCAAAGDARPFAAEFHDGLVYVGITCTAESTQNRAQLDGYVYSFNPNGGGFNQVLRFPLDYDRGCVDQINTGTCEINHPADWLPWIASTNPPTWPLDYYSGLTNTYPQPWLTDIEFDNNGDMILGLRDRWGDMSGNFAPSTISGDQTLYHGITAGDVLRACVSGAGSWAIEDDASCGSSSTAGAGSGQGPGGGEFYFEDNLTDYHDELGMGTVMQLPGQPTVVTTAFDPIPINSELFDAGLRWMDNVTGQTTRAYRVYNGDFGSPVVFGKSNGLGGMEAFCPPAPIEIGNRVWYDLNNNGIQDPGEPYGAGVTVNLYDSTGTLIATTITNAEGEYLFTSATDNVEFNTEYSIRLDNPADYASGGPLFEWFLTRNDAGGANQRDSDARMIGGFPTINMRTGDPGNNNHTFDFGFSRERNICCDEGDNGGGEFEVSEGLQLDKSVDPPFAQPGDTVTWTIRVSHGGGSALPSVTVNDTVPDGLEIVSASSTAGTVSTTSQRITIVISPLNPSQTVTITIQTRISDNPGTLIFDNTAFADGLSDTARLVIAGELVRTGETPWWRTPLIVIGLGIMVIGAGYGIRRRFHAA